VRPYFVQKSDPHSLALEDKADRDLTSAAQSELKRLGCYDAKVGRWELGPESQAALKAFGERAGGAWANKPRRELVRAPRNDPAAFCVTECVAKASGGRCAVAAAPKGKESVGPAKVRLMMLHCRLNADRRAAASGEPNCFAFSYHFLASPASGATPTAFIRLNSPGSYVAASAKAASASPFSAARR
jgi:hypothetical protein